MNAAKVRHSCCSTALDIMTVQHSWNCIAILARDATNNPALRLHDATEDAASLSVPNGKPSDGTRQC